MRERFIIHLNVADFAVAVERAVDVRLRRRPVVIAPESTTRAAVYDMSEEAYQSGVRKGMPLGRAMRRCREAVVLPPHPDRYERAMTRFLRHALHYSPRIEATDHQGHLFIDATGTGKLFGAPPDLAWRIRKNVRRDMGFDPIWSVGPNKLVAKVATRIVKPSGEYVVNDGEKTDFLYPLPLHLIPGIERGDLERLLAFNLTRAGQVSALTAEQLSVLLGKRGPYLWEAVRGIDPSPVLPLEQKPASVTAEHSFGNDTNEVAKLEHALYGMVEKAAAELYRRRMVARGLRVLLDYSDGRRAARQAALSHPSADDFQLFAAARSTLQQACKRRVRIRHLRLTCRPLIYPPPLQQSLFSGCGPEEEPRQALATSLHTIRQRYGCGAVRPAFTLT